MDKVTPTEAVQTPGWSDADLRDPHGNAEKAGKVRAMFGAIAGSYDLNNRLHSLGLDQAWRRRAVREAAVRPGNVVVDVACGTGDLTEQFARTEASRVIGVDFTPQMLEIAKSKLARRDVRVKERVSYIEGDAQALPFDDASADVVSIAFGIRNVTDPAKAIAEFARILKPGGRLVILEFGRPRMGLARWLNGVYCARVMPRTATLISGDRTGAYKYLPRSVGTFMDPATLRGMIEGAGFGEVTSRDLTFGICVCYRAVKR